MIESVKLNNNGYTKKYTDGRNTSVVGGCEDDEEVQEYITDGGIVEEQYTAEEKIDILKTETISIVKTHLNKESQAYGYDNIDKARAVATSTISEWQEDGLLFNKLYDDCWTLAIEAQNNITLDFDIELFKSTLPTAPKE